MRLSLEDTKHDLIKAHILDPENSPLPPGHQRQLERIVSVSKLLANNPITRQVVSIHRIQYPEISKTTAYEDVKLATRLFSTLHTFDFDFYQSWLVNDIVKNIQECRRTNRDIDRRVIAMEHANLAKILGKKPEDMPDITRTEKHQFYILVQNNVNVAKLSLDNLADLPPATLEQLNQMIFSGTEITEETAAKLMNT